RLASVGYSTPALAQQLLEHRLRQAGAGPTIGAGVSRARAQAGSDPLGDEAIDRLLTGGIGVAHLAEEGPQGHGRGIDALAVGAPGDGEGVVDALRGQLRREG